MKIEFFKKKNHHYMVDGTKVIHVNTDGLINDLPILDFVENEDNRSATESTESEFKEAVQVAFKKIGLSKYL